VIHLTDADDSKRDPLKGDDHRAALTALRDILADHLRLADPNVSAQIAARLQSVLSEIAGLPVPATQTASDRIREQREKRRAS
jgi:hypothetical protein